MTIKNGCPTSHKVWNPNNTSLLNDQKCRACVKICSTSPVIVTFLYELNILEWDITPQTKTNVKNIGGNTLK